MSRRSLLEQWIAQVNARQDIKESTKRTYIADARRILETDDGLPGWGYRTVLRGLTALVEARLIKRKSLF